MLVLLWVLLALLESCGFMPIDKTVIFDQPFTDSGVRRVRPGETTRDEILDWFGPPFALARPGTTIKVPHWNRAGVGLEDIPADR